MCAEYQTYCPICQSSSIHHKYRTFDAEYHVDDKPYDFWQCNSCGTYFQNPLPSRGEISQFYKFVSNQEYGAYQPLKPLLLTEFDKELIAQRKWNSLTKLAATFRGADNRVIDLLQTAGQSQSLTRVLDVGCGGGYFSLLLLKYLQIPRSGLVGIDIYQGVEELGRQLGLRFICSRLEDFQEGDFDLISMSHVLEHEPAPRQYIEAAYERLRNNGLLYLSIPNAQSLPARVFGKKWVCHSVPRHIYNFPRRAILELVKRRFRLETYSAGDFYTFMFSRYYNPVIARLVESGLFAMPLIKAALYAMNLGDNQSVVLRKVR
jgi:SAM-dependent methyltransferase